MVEAKNQGVSEAAASDLEAAKEEARSMLESGSTIEEIEAATKLGRNQILGIKGSMVKANKKALEKTEIEPSDLGKADDEEKTLISDFKGESSLASSALVLARNKSRLRQTDPALYNSLFPSGQPESNTSRLADLEIARYIRSMRLEEEGAARHNNGDSQATLGLQKQIDELREERRKKDFEDLKGEIAELRQDLRSSAGSTSDLAVVVREGKDLLVKALENPGPLRNYLTPDNVNIKPPHEAPALQGPDARNGVLEALRPFGYVTKIIQRPS